ncbi:MAG: hypothetical protein J6S21_06835, partial [Victivallales bacterium]|nr:hypothetical protein [Victivallales bacterium]
MSTDSRNDEVQLPRCWSSEEVDPAATRTSLGFLAPPCFLALAVIILCGLSLNMVYSATIAEHGSRFLNMQIIWMLVGIAAAAAGTYLPLEKLYRYSLLGVIIIAVPLLYLI